MKKLIKYCFVVLLIIYVKLIIAQEDYGRYSPFMFTDSLGDKVVYKSMRKALRNPENVYILDLSGKKLCKLSPKIEQFKNLVVLNLGSGPKKCLRKKIIEHSKKIGGGLHHLDRGRFKYIKKNKLSELPHSIVNLKNLQYIDLSYNQFTQLPDWFGDLVSLIDVDIKMNTLETLPESFGNLVNLEWLTLTDNKLSSLPESFGNLSQLTSLYLADNSITELPVSFSNLTRIEVLVLSNNKLEIISEDIGNMSYLQTLFINNNKIKKVPNTYCKLKKLKKLDISDNNLPLSVEKELKECLPQCDIFGSVSN